MTGGGPFGLRPGQWTDDTSMALCLGASLIESGGFDPLDQMRRYVRWRDEGYMSSTGCCFDIGNTVSDALSPASKPRATPTPDRPNRWSAGNGSLMRLAPAPMFFAADAETGGGAVRRQFPHHPRGGGGRGRVPLFRRPAGRRAERGWTSRRCSRTATPRSRASGREASRREGWRWWRYGSFKVRQPPEIKGSGYVVESLEAALWAFHNSRDFREGALMAANLGDDADTTAAIYGQIAGAHYGASGIPAGWRAILSMADDIAQMADSLHAAAMGRARGRSV